MKKHLIILSALVLAGCTVSEIGDNTVELRSEGAVYAAGFEEVGTKVYVDTDLKSHWTADDRISIFTSTHNEEYRFDGLTGDKSGTFTRFGTGNGEGSELPTSYAVYPFSDGTSISAEGEITVNLPAVQSYAENSYGLGANTMVAVAESKTSTDLFFRNVCGYVVVRLYGEGSVKSISITGNNNEKIAGQATVKAEYGQAPVASMSESATTSITLDCGEGVVLGKTVEDATSFWFAVPPVTFSQGFTIKVTNTDLWSMEKTMKVERTVVRNVKNPLAPLEVNFDIPREGNIEFEDANFKAYCVQNFDTNGDGEISYEEGLAVKAIDVITDNICSLIGVEHFSNLELLGCRGSGYSWNEEKQTYIGSGHLKALDVSNNTALRGLWCHYNQLTSLDVSNKKTLRGLWCLVNQLTSLDVSGCTTLTTLECCYNQLTNLAFSNSTALTYLDCTGNQLASLDVSESTTLDTLFCDSNQLLLLDLSKNTALTYLDCHSNHISTLNVSNHTALKELFCSSDHLTTLNISGCSAIKSLFLNSCTLLSHLDASGCTSLSDLSCTNSPLSFLDISGCTSLTKLTCNNCHLASIDVSTNESLTELSCVSNQLSYLDVSKNTALTWLNCQSNQLSYLDVSKNTGLTDFRCGDNQLAVLNISNNTALKYLDCPRNQLTSLDVSNNLLLTTFNCHFNQLSSLDVSHNEALKSMRCYSNNLTSLDISNNPLMTRLRCYSNPYLTEIWLNTGQTIADFQYDTDVATIYYK